jgi:hypothetical protein
MNLLNLLFPHKETSPQNGCVNTTIDKATEKLRHKTSIKVDKSKTDIIKSKEALKLIFEDENVRIFIEKLKGVIENE